MHTLNLFTLFVILFCFHTLTLFGAPYESVIQGVIIDASTGSPVQGSRIVVRIGESYSTSVVSGVDGFAVKIPPNEGDDIVVMPTDETHIFSPNIFVTTAGLNHVSSAIIFSRLNTGLLTGMVFSASGAPTNNIHVIAYNQDDEIIASVLSGYEELGNGAYNLRLPPGNYRLRADDQNPLPFYTDVSVNIESNLPMQNINLWAYEGVSISGVISVCESTIGANGAEVRIDNLIHDAVSESTIADVDGSFVFHGLNPGYARIVVRHGGEVISSNVLINATNNPAVSFCFGSAMITGIVTDWSGNLPLSNIQIRAAGNHGHKYQSFTEQDGSFTLSNLVSGTYEVFASDGKKAFEWHTNLTVETATGITLKAGNLVLTGIVKTTNGNIISDVMAKIKRINGGDEYRAFGLDSKMFSDENGTLVFTNLLDGLYQVTLTKKPFIPLTITNIMLTASTSPLFLDATMYGGGAISGHVYYGDSPLNHATGLQILVTSHNFLSSGNTDDLGVFKIEGLTDGVYIIESDSNSYVDFVVTNVLVSSSSSAYLGDIAVALVGGLITGTVSRSDSPAPEMIVSVTQLDFPWKTKSTWSKADGSFAISNLVDSSYSVMVLGSSGALASNNVVVSSSNIISVDFSLPND